MNLFGTLATLGGGAFVLLQLIRPAIPEKASADLEVPSPVRHVFERDCFSCHSDQRKLAWFDEIVPAYWLVRHDVLTARKRLNFSTLNEKPAAQRTAALYETVNMMQLGAMPLARFRMLHPEAKVTNEDLAVLKAYLSPWKELPPRAAAATVVKNLETSRLKTAAELNGLAFDENYTNWKALSFTDRGDNNTLRFILGNEVAVEAARSGRISPWPDGARIAKIAWQKVSGTDGLIHPGKFVQVELMEKDTLRFEKTNGWGWGRWRSLALQPYGRDARFVEECIVCHLPVRGNDSVYSLPITGASVPGREVVNARASLPPSLPYHPLDWSPVTMYIDPTYQTTATLFASDAAQKHSSSSVLALVTWSQREDPHWFGARIPDQPRSVEFVNGDKTTQADGYSRYAGPGLPLAPLQQEEAHERVRFILSLPKAELP